MIGSTNITQGFAFSKEDEDNVLKTGIEIKGEEMKRRMRWFGIRAIQKNFHFHPITQRGRRTRHLHSRHDHSWFKRIWKSDYPRDLSHFRARSPCRFAPFPTIFPWRFVAKESRDASRFTQASTPRARLFFAVEKTKRSSKRTGLPSHSHSRRVRGGERARQSLEFRIRIAMKNIIKAASRKNCMRVERGEILRSLIGLKGN